MAVMLLVATAGGTAWAVAQSASSKPAANDAAKRTGAGGTSKVITPVAMSAPLERCTDAAVAYAQALIDYPTENHWYDYQHNEIDEMAWVQLVRDSGSYPPKTSVADPRQQPALDAALALGPSGIRDTVVIGAAAHARTYGSDHADAVAAAHWCGILAPALAPVVAQAPEDPVQAHQDALSARQRTSCDDPLTSLFFNLYQGDYGDYTQGDGALHKAQALVAKQSWKQALADAVASLNDTAHPVSKFQSADVLTQFCLTQ